MKKPISLAVALTLCAGLTVPAQAAFSDVPANLWSASAIQAAADKGIVAGFPDGSFHPDDDVTNVQFCVMLYRAFYPSVAGEKTGFADWYMPAMEALHSVNVYQGVSFTRNNGAFDWDTARANTGNPLSRYDMAQLLANIMAQQGKTVTDEEKAAAQSSISDWSSIPESCRDSVLTCYAAKILGGMPDGTFSGSNVMNRAQGCVVIGNLSDYLSAAPGTQTPGESDNRESTPSSPANTVSSPANNTNSTAAPSSGDTSSANSGTNASSPFEREERSSSFSDFLNNRTNENARTEEDSSGEPSTGRTPRPSTEVPSTPKAPASSATLADGSEITEDNVRRIIEDLKSDYPDGLSWSNSNSYFSKALRTTGHGCAGFALICSDAAFGDLPVSENHSDFNRIRVGDILHVDKGTHYVVVLEKKGDSVIVTEGNMTITINGERNGPMIYWGREISRSELEAGNFTAQTRYPK